LAVAVAAPAATQRFLRQPQAVAVVVVFTKYLGTQFRAQTQSRFKLDWVVWADQMEIPRVHIKDFRVQQQHSV
jgi:hypothetical protein